MEKQENGRRRRAGCRELKITVKPPYLTGDKYVRIFLQPVVENSRADYGFYIWLAKIFGLALLAESAMVAILFSIL